MEDKIIITVGTSNLHKIKELNNIGEKFNVEFVLPSVEKFDPVEDGKTFLENARIKALEASRVSFGELFLADDSGLCVDFLNGEPGIYSARYEKTPEKRIEKLLLNMKNAKERSAHFTCAMCLVNKKGEILKEVEEKVEGKIAFTTKGEGGFGYDPVFVVDGLNKTMAELTTDEKNTLSHRGKALTNMLKWIRNEIKV